MIKFTLFLSLSFGHRSKYGIRFGWDSQKPLNQFDYWNPWSAEIPWITLSSHPLDFYIEDLLQDAAGAEGCLIDDSYYTMDYLVQIRRRYSLQVFHDKLMEILNSFQPIPWRIPKLYSNETDDSGRRVDLLGELIASSPSTLLELKHPDGNVTVVHYASIVCENYFNLPAMLFNRSNLGYYRLKLFWIYLEFIYYHNLIYIYK